MIGMCSEKAGLPLKRLTLPLQQIAKVLQHRSRTVENHNSFTMYESDYLSHLGMPFKHSKSIVVFHCSARLLQDFCNLLSHAKKDKRAPHSPLSQLTRQEILGSVRHKMMMGV